MTVRAPHRVNRSQRRDNVRVNCELKGDFTWRDDGHRERFTVRVISLSASGAGVICDYRLAPHTRLDIRLMLPSGVVDTHGTVVRCQRHKGNQYNIAFAFSFRNRRHAVTISRYVFDLQRAAIRKAHGENF